MPNSEDKVQDLRTMFLTKLETSDSDIFHPDDIKRVKNDDGYVKRFILHNDGNQEMAFTMLWETCEWRKKFGTNDIAEKNVNRSILETGSVFSHGRDKDGKRLLIFKSKNHVKGAFDLEDHKRCLVYWVERLERQEKGEMISLFFDMDGAVLANMDLEYTKYLISLFKNYYPYFLNYIIIFEMPWVLNAMFRIIKTWLPPKAVEKMKMVNKSNVKEYVDPEYALKSWGGKVSYIFHLEPEENASPSSSASGDDGRKKVHFADGSFSQDQLNERSFEDELPQTSPQKSYGLTISPPEEMLFTQEGSEVTSSITLKNDGSQGISYKIKTTSPEKFRVRPSIGTLSVGSRVVVSVVLLPGYLLQSLKKDKFLVMSIPIENLDVSCQEIGELWKKVSEEDKHQHKLRCAVPQAPSKEFGVKNGSQPVELQEAYQKLCSDISKVSLNTVSLSQEIKLIRQQQWIIILAIIVLIFALTYIIYDDYIYQTSCSCSHERHL